MKHSIITPSYNMLSYLKCASASISDQEGVDFEHLVMDGGSSDGTAAWLRENPGIIGISEKDHGMYDAVNKGLKRARGDIISYLNCDEQYLPGTLAFVHDYFKSHPAVDIVFGNTLLVAPDGKLIAYRKGYRVNYAFIAVSHLYVLTCTMFFRRRIIDQGYFFNDKLRAVADMDFVLKLLKAGFTVRHLSRYLSTFTYTGDNLSVSDTAKQETRQLNKNIPIYLKLLKYPLNITRLATKYLSGAYCEKYPLIYEIYDLEDLTKRKHFEAATANHQWPAL